MGLTTDDVIALMNSVVAVSVDLYPNTYNTDAEFLKIIKPILKSKNISLRKKETTIEMSYNTILKCISDYYDVKKYISEFGSTFNIEEGIEKNYSKLIKRYSSPEIIILYRIYKNLVYFNITIHTEQDSRPERAKYKTSLRLPDLKIHTISIKLRDYCEQKTVDKINKYIIKKTPFYNNIMSKNNMFNIDNTKYLFTLIDNVENELDYVDDTTELISNLMFLNIGEISDANILVITDFPVL